MTLGSEGVAEGATPVVDDLEVERLLQAASAETGLEDFGNGEFHESLSRYIDSLLSEGNLSAMGVMTQRQYFHRLLVNRLRFEDDLKRHPEILDEVIHKPIIIVALPRTGTSKLHRMLSRAPGVQPLTFWRILNPAPFRDAPMGGPDPRIAAAREFETLISQYFPQLLAAHPWQTEEADEECLLQELTIQGVSISTRARVPSYTAWMLKQPMEGSYQYLYRLLQYLQWQDGGGSGRPWVLKSPSHLGRLATLQKTFSDATFVVCHRDLNVVMPSTARLIEVLRRMTTDEIDLVDLGEEMIELWSGEMHRFVEQRDQLGDAVLIMDVDYVDIRSDPLTVVREIFRWREEPLSAKGEAEIARWEEEFPQFRFGPHEYSLERYGMTPGRLEAAFAGYLARFRPHPEPR